MSYWSGPSSLDRVADARSDAQLDEAWRRALVLRVDGDGRVAADAGRPAAVPATGSRTGDDIYLGVFDGRAWFARSVPELVGESIAWRDAPPDEHDPIAAAVFLSRWNRMAPVCERCGSPTVPDLGGVRRVCPSCGWIAFARIDPCVIVAITDPDDRLLLARNFQWPVGRVSIIAGFVEAGESVEQACHREVAEEVGVTLESLSYVSSQPWPMPRSLMLGFEARAVDSRINIDGDEILAGTYYTRAELAAAVSIGEVVLPGGDSIARHLIERWLSSR
ncbi:NAD+ diphosphatase [Tessaracoccus bendigoensis DSM 12906]|uniref:NAD(+) diphosphatase n=1 Tax=Tessaracoccus bendigoensis DSM 12906 TaxID=1123357 RepID=A0A1M6AJA1_9ACTN|nr:NAD(+) diphosphatase [Tessaracoccus bendigoensis]SHI36535.1 NAD+ diphosphatase [Tessaracoccus bendigoensis DSM 12906]